MFDPVTHLSGLVAAAYLETLDWRGKRVLEVGTGCGLLAGVLHDGGAEVVAVDVSPAAVACAASNLSGTGVDVRLSDVFDGVCNERFDAVVTNPPYEVGYARNPTLRSSDVLVRLASEWELVASSLLLLFPTDSEDLLDAAGFSVSCIKRIPTEGRELGVYTSLL